jgi:hypothetical protein
LESKQHGPKKRLHEEKQDCRYLPIVFSPRLTAVTYQKTPSVSWATNDHSPTRGRDKSESTELQLTSTVLSFGNLWETHPQEQRIADKLSAWNENRLSASLFLLHKINTSSNALFDTMQQNV